MSHRWFGRRAAVVVPTLVALAASGGVVLAPAAKAAPVAAMAAVSRPNLIPELIPELAVPAAAVLAVKRRRLAHHLQ